MGINVSDLPPKAQEQIFRKMQELQREIIQSHQRYSKPSKAQEKQRKYHNQPCEVDGIKFDSQKEARRYRELMALLRAGKIRDLKLQPQFTLQESYKTLEGKRVQAIRYVADFSYELMPLYWTEYESQCPDDAWIKVVEDVKSKATKTRVYEMKRKLMLDRFGIEIREV